MTDPLTAARAALAAWDAPPCGKTWTTRLRDPDDGWEFDHELACTRAAGHDGDCDSTGRRKPGPDHLRTAIAAYDEAEAAAKDLDHVAAVLDGVTVHGDLHPYAARVAAMAADLAALRLEHAAHAAILEVMRRDRNRLAEAARAIVAVWDAPIEDDGAALGAKIDGLRDALAGRGEG